VRIAPNGAKLREARDEEPPRATFAGYKQQQCDEDQTLTGNRRRYPSSVSLNNRGDNQRAECQDYSEQPHPDFKLALPFWVTRHHPAPRLTKLQRTTRRICES
jgi:hypothetical protein